MNKRVLTFGQIVLERQYFVDKVSSINEVSFVSKINNLASSKELNASRIIESFCGVDYVSSIGNDDDGDTALKYLKSYKINFDHVTTSKNKPTGQVVVMTDLTGSSAITVFVGANEDVSLSGVKVEKYDFIYTSTANPLDKLYNLIKVSNDCYTPILIDFPNKQTEFDFNMLKSVNFICPNRQEAQMLLGIKIRSVRDALIACEKLKTYTDGSVFITLDSDGCVALERGSSEAKHIPTKRIDVVDMTGSGDIFRGTFTGKYIQTNNFWDSLEYATKVATKSCEYQGVDNSILQSKNHLNKI